MEFAHTYRVHSNLSRFEADFPLLSVFEAGPGLGRPGYAPLGYHQSSRE